ncbi:MAG: class I SAM-dependent methyltransferase [Deltaproteobacteria bacterium]|nr:class I SAM-dependent methyltransferase [Deltaproteobacteria bacterium]
MADHICPWWVGYLLANPLRRVIENPEKLLSPYVSRGMTAIDYGCGMGFFTIPLARLVGPGGKVIAVDIQEKMLNGLRKRAQRTGLSERIMVLAAGNEQQIADKTVDFVAALYVVHEIVDHETFFQEIYRIMKTGAKVLIVEPRFHVEAEEFRRSIDIAQSIGFDLASEVNSTRRLKVVLSRS